MKKIILGAIAAAAMTSMVSADGHSSIEARQAAMKAVGAAAKAKDFAAMNTAALAAQAAFKEDTSGISGVKTEASPAIWTNSAKFDEIMGQLVSLSAAGSQDVFGTCKACHADYRIKN